MTAARDGLEKQLANARERVQALAVPAANRRAILAYADHCFARGLSPRRVLKYLIALRAIAERMQVDFHRARRADIEALVR